MDCGHQFDEHVRVWQWFGFWGAPSNERWNATPAYPQFNLAAAMAELKAQVPADCRLVYETHNETIHGEEAFARLFGWDDHQWLRDLIAPDAKTSLK